MTCPGLHMKPPPARENEIWGTLSDGHPRPATCTWVQAGPGAVFRTEVLQILTQDFSAGGESMFQ